MTRVLVVTLPEKGHYHPLLGPAGELSRRGVETAFATVHDCSAELREAGVARVLMPAGAQKPSTEIRGEALARILRDPAALRGWIRTMLVEVPEANVAPLRAILRDFRPDVVAIDTMAYDAAIAAHLEGIPWVGWATSLNPVIPDAMDSELIRTLRALDPDRHALFARHGIEARFRVSDVLSPFGTAVFATPAFAGAAESDVHLVGPSLGGARQGEAVDFTFTEGRPLIYVSFGSQAWHQPRRFERVMEAAQSLDFAVLAAVGDLAEQWKLSAPARTKFVSFAPQLEVLRRAQVLVTHGGANSVMEAISAGVPMLVSPLCNDQPHSAQFVHRAGAGRVLDLDTCSVRELVECLHELAAPGLLRERTKRLAEDYARHNGAIGAAELALRAARGTARAARRA